MSLSSINDMDSHNLIIGLYSDALENDNTIPEPQFTIDGNDYSTLTWSGTTMAKPTEAQLVAKYNSIKTSIRDKLVRERRDRLLIESDKYAVKDFPFRTKTKRDQWMSYRTNLRNLTDNLNNFSLDLNNFEITNFDTHKPTEPEEESGLETKTFDEDDIIIDGKFIITGHNTLNNFLVGDGTSYVPKTPSQIKSILDLEVGTDVQAYDSGLNAIANISPSNNKIAVFSGPTTAKLIDFRDEDNMISNSSTSIPSQQSVKAYVDTKVSNLVSSAPGTLDTLNELAAALGDDANFSSTVSTSLGQKLVKSSNLSDLTSASTARTNLGLTIGSDVQAYNANLVPVSANPGTSAGGNLSTISIGGTNYSIPSGGGGGITISNNADNRVLTGDGTNANAESLLTFDGNVLTIGNVSITSSTYTFSGSSARTVRCRTYGTPDGSVKKFGLALISGTDSGSSDPSSINLNYNQSTTTVLRQHNSYNVNELSYQPSTGTIFAGGFSGNIYSESNADIELNPNGSGLVTLKGSSTRGSGSLKFYSETNVNYVTVKAPTNSSLTSYTLTLPTTNGDANQVLMTDGNGNLSWTTMSSGGGGGGGDTFSSLTVNGNMSCSGYLDIEGGIKMGTSDKIEWVNAYTYISGTDTSMTIDADDTLKIYCDTEMNIYSPKLNFYNNTTNDTDLKVVSQNSTTFASLVLTSRNGANFGDTWKVKNYNGSFQIYNDKTTKGLPDDLIFELTGHANPLLSNTNVYGYLNVESQAYLKAEVRLNPDKRLYWNDQNTYITGNATSITVDADDTLNLIADNIINLNTSKVKYSNGLTTGTDFEIRNTYTSNGEASITLVGDNGDDLGDGWRIRINNQSMYFSSDIVTDETYNVNVFSLTNNSNQSGRYAYFYSNLDVRENVKLSSEKKIYWSDTNQYISGNITSITIDGDDYIYLNSDISTNFTSPTTTFSGNVDVGSGIDVTGNITCSGYLDIEGAIHMSASDKIQWVNHGTYINGTDTSMTIDADATLIINADTSITITSATSSFSGHLDVGSGLDVTGNITCSGYLDIEGAIKMGTSDKIEWVNTGTYIYGTDTGITMDADDNFLLICDVQAKVSGPLMEYESITTDGAHFKVKSTNTTSGYSKISLISKNNNYAGETWDIKNELRRLKFINNKSTVGIVDDLIFELVGDANPLLSNTYVYGYLTVDNNAYLKNNVSMVADKKLYWNDTNTYISGNATSLTIDADDTLNLVSDVIINLSTPKMKYYYGGTETDFEIRCTNTSNGSASLTLVSDNGEDLGDGWRIKALNQYMYFSSDIVTDETYTTNIMTLKNHATQANRITYFYSALDVRENIKLPADKKLYWSDTNQYISGNTTSITIESDDYLYLNSDVSTNFTSPTTTFSGNVDVASGIDVTGNITCSGYLDIEGAIHMSASDKIQWVNTGTYISGTDTAMTIDADDTLSVNADTSMTFTTPTSSFSGHLDVGAGLDVTGNMTCSGYLDIEGAIKMGHGDKIEWVNTNTYISGTDTSLTIDADDNFIVHCDTDAKFSSPILEHYSALTDGAHFKVKSTNTTSGYSKFSLISKNNNAVGETWEIKNELKRLKFFNNATTVGTLDDLIFELVGNANPLLSNTNVSGYLTVENNAYLKNNVSMVADKKLYWNDTNTYISGNATTLTIDADDTLNLVSDVIINLSTAKMKYSNASSITDFEIRNTNNSNGSASLTLVSDAGEDLGDGWQIRAQNNTLLFSSDISTDETYNIYVMSLTNNSTQANRYAYFYANLDVRENIKLPADKKLYWSDTNQYISGNTTSITIESDDYLYLNSDVSTAFSSPTTTFSGNVDVGSGIDVTGNITCSGYLDIEGAIHMSASDKIHWVNTGTYISGTDTAMTIDADDTLSVNADTSITFTSPTSSFSGHLDVGSGLDVTGNMTCSGILDIEGAIKMGHGDKIEWVNTYTYILGTDTSLTIDADDNFLVICDTDAKFSSPILEHYSGLTDGAHFKVKSTNTTSGYSKLSLISKNNNAVGETWEIKNELKKLKFINNTSSVGTPDDLIFELVGNANPLLSNTNVSGYLTVENISYLKNNVSMLANKKLYWNDTNTYISGDASSITIDADDTLNLVSDVIINLSTAKMKYYYGGTETDFEIRCTNTSNGSASLTLVSDNGEDLGDGWRIKALNQYLYFGSDIATDETYTTNIMTLKNHATQSSRLVNIYGKLEVSNGFSVEFGSDATADMFYRNSSGDFARLPKGTAGQVLTMNSNATAPEWSSSSSGGVSISNNVNNRVLTGDGTNANGEANMTFDGSTLTVVGKVTCTSYTTSSNTNLDLDPNGSGVVVFKGNSTRGSGQIKLNCENNSHGITIKGPPHSSNATYTLTLPNTIGGANEVLKTDGSGNLSWTTMSGGGEGASALNDLSDVSISSLSAGQVLKYNGTNWVNDTDNTGSGGTGGGGLPTGVSYTGSGASAEFVVTGNIRATADITAYHSSDRRFKDNLTRISEPNEKIKKINGYEFDWNEKHEHYKNTHDVGVVAQEIEEVLPEVVTEREDGYKAVKYERIIALLIESNKDLLRRVEELEEKLKK